MNHRPAPFHPPRELVTLCAILAAVGAAAFVVGLLLEPRRGWANLLLGSYALVGLGLAGAVFVALLHVTGAGWATALRRVPEAMTALLPLGAAGLLLVFLAYPALYPWAAHHAGNEGLSAPFRDFWLSYPFFLGRALFYLACWGAFAFALVRASRRQDLDGDLAHTRRGVRLSAAFLVVFAVTFWLASHDWVMSLEPEWASTVFSLYNFAGLFLGGLAVVILLTVWLQRAGPFRRVLSADHLHDLGKLLFAFSIFWMYTWFCQYMLIWYVNNPEETVYYVRRLEGAWSPLLVVSLVLNWGVPFVVLLPRSSKRSAGVLVKVCCAVLLGRWLDLYVLILPAAGCGPVPGAAEVGLLLAAAGLALLVFFSALRRAPLVPVNDPFLPESWHASQ